MTDSLHFNPDSILVLGRSIGTTVAMNTAANSDIAGLVLVTPLTTGKELGKASGLGVFANFAGKSFNNLEKCDKIRCPVLIIHGTRDEVIPYSMGFKVFETIQSQKSFVSIENGNHNRLEYYSEQYWNSIEEFIKKTQKQTNRLYK